MQGIERSVALDPSALEYFRLHIDLDVAHGEMLERCLIRWATSEANRNEIRRGALRSLEARAAFWSALVEQLFPQDVSSDNLTRRQVDDLDSRAYS